MNLYDSGKEIVHRRRPATCPVYQPWQTDSVEAIGSAVLLSIRSTYFVVTANHVLSELPAPDVYIGGDKLVGLLRAQFTHTVGSPDRFDLAIAVLEAKQIAALGRDRFLKPADVSLADNPDLSRPLGSKYLALGFPAKENPPDLDKPVTPRSMSIFALPVPEARYREVEANPTSHLVLQFDRKQAFAEDQKITSPKLKGMSGCGIWAGPDGHAGSTTPGSLVAILTEHHEGSKKLIVATRVRVAFEGLRHVPRPAS